MTKKGGIVLVTFFLVVAVLLLFVFKIYKSKSISFVYPRGWFVKEIDESPYFFNGLIVSQADVKNDEASYEKGGFIQISSTPEPKYKPLIIFDSNISIKEYVKAIKDDEDMRIKNGGFPIVPGPSQFEYVQSPVKPPPEGFEEVSSMATRVSNSEAHLYWKVKNSNLYEIFVKYPTDSRKNSNFEYGERLIFSFLNIR